jgi:hypothetical protein
MLGGYWRPLALIAGTLVSAFYGMLIGVLVYPQQWTLIIAGGSSLIALLFCALLSKIYTRYSGVRNICLTVQTIDGDDDQYDIKYLHYKMLGQDKEGKLRYLLEDIDSLNRYILCFQKGQAIEGLCFKAQETLVNWWVTSLATNFPTGVWMGECNQTLSPFEIVHPDFFARYVLRRKERDPNMKIPVVNVYATNMTAQLLAMGQLNITDLKNITREQIEQLYKDFITYDSHEAVTNWMLTKQNLEDVEKALEDTSGPWVDINPPKINVEGETKITKRQILLIAGAVAAIAVIGIVMWYFILGG